MNSQLPKNNPVTVPELLRLLGAPRFIMLMGLPASGKSTLAALIESAGYRRFNADKIREELYGDESEQGDSKKVFSLLLSRLDETLAAGTKAVIDLTNLTRKGRLDFARRAHQAGQTPEIMLLDVPASVCWARNCKRQRHVGLKRLLEMAFALKRQGLPATNEGSLTVLRPSRQAKKYKIVPQGTPLLVMTEALPSWATGNTPCRSPSTRR